MSAPYSVTITVKNAAGEEMTALTQRLESYEALVAYQKAVSAGIFGMADEVIKSKSAGKKA
jgi:hypothetical protein